MNRTVNPLLTSLPAKFRSIYPNQIVALREIVEAFEEVDVVVLDAPTGTGKTVLGESVRRLLKVDKATYICHSKALQDQFVADFPYSNVIKGRANYPTEKFPGRFNPESWSPDHLSADDCTWSKANPVCQWCSQKSKCPYEIAKKDAITGDLAVANTSYWLAECNGPGRLRGRGLVIADEADTLEAALMSHVSVEISRKRMAKWGWDPPKKSTVPSSWLEWLDEKIPVVAGWVAEEKGRARRLEERMGAGASSGPLPGSRGALVAKREARYLEGLYEGLSLVKYGLENDEPWVYTGEGSSRDKTDGPKAVSFKPSRVDKLAGKILWAHGTKFLLMSATVISAAEMLGSLGYEGKWRSVKVSSTFPVENRKIYPVMLANMTYKNEEVARVKMGDALIKVCERHPNERILVHCTSYRLAHYLHAWLTPKVGGSRAVITHSSSQDKNAALIGYSGVPHSVLLSPSMDRGVDLPGDLCRVQVICKVPFPSLGDKVVSARLHSPGGQTWYSVQTVRSIVQMTGRAVRSPTDHATTYILDAQFQSMIWSKSRGLLPSWWREAVDWKEGERLKRTILL